MRIIFMGTPEFATTILQAIHENSAHEVVGVVTATDKPAGRGQKISQSHVKCYAQEKDLNILQPENLKDPDFLKNLTSLNADCYVVVAFRMLPQVVWSIPPKGTINLHGSLLPKYRGAAPINWAVINGEKKTGVTTFFINENIDTGDVILQKEMSIGENDTAGIVHDRMMHLGADAVLETLQLIEHNKIQTQPQNTMTQAPCPAPKIFKKDCQLDFRKNAVELHRFICGMSPFPGAWMKIKQEDKKEKVFKIYLSNSPSSRDVQVNTPQLVETNNQLLLVWGSNVLALLQVQLEGKKRMEIQQFLQGFNAKDWEIIH